MRFSFKVTFLCVAALICLVQNLFLVSSMVKFNDEKNSVLLGSPQNNPSKLPVKEDGRVLFSYLFGNKHPYKKYKNNNQNISDKVVAIEMVSMQHVDGALGVPSVSSVNDNKTEVSFSPMISVLSVGESGNNQDKVSTDGLLNDELVCSATQVSVSISSDFIKGNNGLIRENLGTIKSILTRKRKKESPFLSRNRNKEKIKNYCGDISDGGVTAIKEIFGETPLTSEFVQALPGSDYFELRGALVNLADFARENKDEELEGRALDGLIALVNGVESVEVADTIREGHHGSAGGAFIYNPDFRLYVFGNDRKPRLLPKSNFTDFIYHELEFNKWVAKYYPDSINNYYMVKSFCCKSEEIEGKLRSKEELDYVKSGNGCVSPDFIRAVDQIACSRSGLEGFLEMLKPAVSVNCATDSNCATGSSSGRGCDDTVTMVVCGDDSTQMVNNSGFNVEKPLAVIWEGQKPADNQNSTSIDKISSLQQQRSASLNKQPVEMQLIYIDATNISDRDRLLVGENLKTIRRILQKQNYHVGVDQQGNYYVLMSKNIGGELTDDFVQSLEPSEFFSLKKAFADLVNIAREIQNKLLENVFVGALFNLVNNFTSHQSNQSSDISRYYGGGGQLGQLNLESNSGSITGSLDDTIKNKKEAGCVGGGEDDFVSKDSFCFKNGKLLSMIN
ncbi:MAG: hypothetical protein WBQ73_03230 [Candidatus Babeliales bacterium]